MLITTLGLSAVALIFFSLLIFVRTFTQTGRKKASTIIKKQKENLIWNGIIFITFVNYLKIVDKARDMINIEKVENQNKADGILLSLLILSYPICIGFFLKINFSKLDSS